MPYQSVIERVWTEIQTLKWILRRDFLLERGFGMSYTVTRLRKRKKRGENKRIITIIELGGA